MPVPGGYALNLGVPRGPTGDIEGVTSFWQGRITVDADAAAARAGLEALNASPILSNDWDSITATGIYYNNDLSAVGIPTPSGLLTCLHFDYGSSATQISFRSNISNPQTWRRAKSSGTWGDWVELYTTGNMPEVTQAQAEAGTGTTPKAWTEQRVAQAIAALAPAVPADVYRRSNILGTVSQSGGVPTGAIIESGTNANGTYIRYANGTQIAIVQESTGSGVLPTPSGGVAGDFQWTYPASFQATPFLQASSAQTITSGGGRIALVGAGSSQINEVFAQGYRYNTDSAGKQAGPVSVIAIGRWF